MSRNVGQVIAAANVASARVSVAPARAPAAGALPLLPSLDHREPMTLRRVFLLVLLLKLYVLFLLYILFLKTDLRNGDKGFFFLREGQSMAERSDEIQGSFFERLAPYDGQWYIDIARKGYRTLAETESRRGTHPPGNYAFFPLLPGILRATEAVTADAYLPATIFLMVLLSALGAAAVWGIAREVGVSPPLAVLLLLAFPTAVFQVVLYTEGIFLLLSGLALYFVLKGRVAAAGIAGLLSGLTRPQGVLLMVPFFIALLLPAIRGKEALSKAALLARALVTLSPLSGLVTLGVFSEMTTGSTSSFLTIQGRWGRSYASSGVFGAIGSVFDYGGPPADLLGLLFGVALLPVLWRRLPLVLSLYGAAMLLFPLSTGSIMSLGRFMSMSIPHFLALALVLEKAPSLVRGTAVASFAVAQILLANGLIAWHLVG